MYLPTYFVFPGYACYSADEKLDNCSMWGLFFKCTYTMLALIFFLASSDRMNSMGTHPMTGLLMLMAPREEIYPRTIVKANFHDIRMPLALQVCTCIGLDKHSNLHIHMYAIEH